MIIQIVGGIIRAVRCANNAMCATRCSAMKLDGLIFYGEHLAMHRRHTKVEKESLTSSQSMVKRMFENFLSFWRKERSPRIRRGNQNGW